LIEGGQVALKTPIILKGLFIVFVSAFFVRGMLEIQPTIAGEILDNGSLGLSLITATAGFGALLASIWIGVRKKDDLKIEQKLIPMLLLGLTTSFVLGFFTDMYLMAFAFTIVGFSTTAVGIGTQTIIQLEVDDLYRARVLTWWSSVSFGSLTFGGILLGSIGEFIPLSIGMIVMPIVGFIFFKIVLIYKFKNKFI